MRVLLAGPIGTETLRERTGLRLEGAPSGQGGPPVAALAASLIRLGHSVQIATLDPSISEPYQISEKDVAVTYLPLRAPPRFRTRVRSIDLFEREIRYLTSVFSNSTADIVHAHWTYEYAEAAIRSHLPHLVTMHDLGWEYFFLLRDRYRFMRLIMKYRSMIRVRHLSVVAPFMAAKAKSYGYFGKVAVIPNCVDMDFPPAGDIKDRLQQPIRIVTIGNTGRIKNVGKSVAAFRVIRQTIGDAELHLFGPGLDRDYAADEPGVVGHGAVVHGELLRFLASDATLLIHPSRMEACSTIIAEAKAQSIPVVAGIRSGGVPYVCGAAGCLLVDIEDADAIAQAGLHILSQRQRYSTMGEEARADVQRRFSRDVVAGEYVKAYGSIVEGRWGQN